MFKNRFLVMSALCASLLINCSAPEKILPGEQVMHFPFAMAIKGDTLLVSSEDSDGKYGYGRLVALNTDAIDNELINLKPDDTIPWERVVVSNVLIPPSCGPISFQDRILFASRADNRLYSATKPLCNKPSQVITSCPQSAALQLSENDPYALAVLEKKPEADIILASYLSSGRIDIIELDKTPSSPTLKVLKYFDINNLVEENLKGDFLTKKVIVSQFGNAKEARVFLLLERKPGKEYIHALQNSKSTFKLALLQKSMGALLLSVKVSDLVKKGDITSADINIINLQEQFGLYLAQDFYFNDAENTAIILARSPETLIKIHIDPKTLLATLLEKQLVCRGAGSMDVSQNLNRIFIPCFSDNRIISLKLSSLALMAVSGLHGRGPTFATVDEAHKTVFVSYNTEGKVGIFDFDMKYLGHFFQPAPINRVGS